MKEAYVKKVGMEKILGTSNLCFPHNFFNLMEDRNTYFSYV